jgi:hypothetical protein
VTKEKLGFPQSLQRKKRNAQTTSYPKQVPMIVCGLENCKSTSKGDGDDDDDGIGNCFFNDQNVWFQKIDIFWRSFLIQTSLSISELKKTQVKLNLLYCIVTYKKMASDMRRTMWICSACTTRNAARHSTCDMCGTAKPDRLNTANVRRRKSSIRSITNVNNGTNTNEIIDLTEEDEPPPPAKAIAENLDVVMTNTAAINNGVNDANNSGNQTRRATNEADNGAHSNDAEKDTNLNNVNHEAMNGGGGELHKKVVVVDNTIATTTDIVNSGIAVNKLSKSDWKAGSAGVVIDIDDDNDEDETSMDNVAFAAPVSKKSRPQQPIQLTPSPPQQHRALISRSSSTEATCIVVDDSTITSVRSMVNDGEMRKSDNKKSNECQSYHSKQPQGNVENK